MKPPYTTSMYGGVGGRGREAPPTRSAGLVGPLFGERSAAQGRSQHGNCAPGRTAWSAYLDILRPIAPASLHSSRYPDKRKGPIQPAIEPTMHNTNSNSTTSQAHVWASRETPGNLPAPAPPPINGVWIVTCPSKPVYSGPPPKLPATPPKITKRTQSVSRQSACPT